MVLSLREKFIELDPIIAFWEKVTERFSEAMTTWTDQFVSNMKQARSKSEPEHDRRVLICGYTEEDDCFCVSTKTAMMDYDDLDVAVVELVEENGYQSQLKTQQIGDLTELKDEDPIAYEDGECTDFQAQIEVSDPSIYPICIQLIHDKVTSLRYNDFSSPSLSTRTAIGEVGTNEKEFHVANKVFDILPERDGYNPALNPKPPDEDPKKLYWFKRDRFVLSAGHGCMFQYALLPLAGYDSVLEEDLKQFCQWGSRTPGHPENFETPGVEVTTGPLGQGFANAVGLALVEKHLAARFNKKDSEIVDYYTYMILGDDCQMEGISNEFYLNVSHFLKPYMLNSGYWEVFVDCAFFYSGGDVKKLWDLIDDKIFNHMNEVLEFLGVKPKLLKGNLSLGLRNAKYITGVLDIGRLPKSKSYIESTVKLKYEMCNYFLSQQNGIDPHTHLAMEYMGTETITVTIDDYFSSQAAALAGGTTMHVDFIIHVNGNLSTGFDAYAGKAKRPCMDYDFHMVITKWNDIVPIEMEIMVKENNINYFKFFMTYKGYVMINDELLLEGFKKCKSLGALAMVHADNIGSYNSRPHENRFLCDGGNYVSYYGRFFLTWYSQVLVGYGDRVLALANLTFEGTSIAAKLSGIQWWYKIVSHAAVLTVGFYNSCNRDNYARITSMFKKHGTALNFACVELHTLDQHEDFPETLADIGLLMESKEYYEALNLLSCLIKEVRTLDDKLLLVESKFHFFLRNLPKAKVALTATRTTANAIIVPPAQQGTIDLQIGILHTEEKDYKTYYSYFFEAFEVFNAFENPQAVYSLKYMLLYKIMVNQAGDVAGIISSQKVGLQYQVPELDAMKAIVDAVVASYYGLHVSTTHCIVDSMVGLGLVYGGTGDSSFNIVGLLDLGEDGEFTLLEHSYIVHSVFIALVLLCNNVLCIDVLVILLVYTVTTGVYHKHYKAAEYGMLLHEYGTQTTRAYEVVTFNKKMHVCSPSHQKLLYFLKITKSVNELILGERPLIYNDNLFCMGQGYDVTNGRWIQWLKMEYFYLDMADVGETELSDSKWLIFIKRLGSWGLNFIGLIVTRFCKKDSDLSSCVNTTLVLIDEIHLVVIFAAELYAQQYNKHVAAMKQIAQFHLEGKVDFKGGSIVMNYFTMMIFGNPTVEIKLLV